MLRRLFVTFCAILFVSFAADSTVRAVPLAPIQRGDIAIRLKPVVTGISAPDYGISPFGDTERIVCPRTEWADPGGE